MRRAASMPPPGIEMSSSARSGPVRARPAPPPRRRCRRRRAPRSRPLSSSERTRPSRKIGWSSARTVRMRHASVSLASGSVSTSVVPAPGRGCRCSSSPPMLSARSRSPARPSPPSGRSRAPRPGRSPGPRSRTVRRQPRRPRRATATATGGAGRVAGGVRQRLLQEAVEADPRRDVERGASAAGEVERRPRLGVAPVRLDGPLGDLGEASRSRSGSDSPREIARISASAVCSAARIVVGLAAARPRCRARCCRAASPRARRTAPARRAGRRRPGAASARSGRSPAPRR